ncbi:uncharacterized protein LOC131151755 [Malania oleifera]|uniref:uncharacterized protein LOC131151755 n=1 Tax=Malania oleifera TaxID=397392 RepID=UPI0025AE7373|nr:uncharacterized protein LOC131151755 [Malania oleifera]XP_057959139.1 uncharacterized protein LOC131151755 [Malania oleifera]
MENKVISAKNNGQVEDDSLCSLSKSMKLFEDNCVGLSESKFNTLVRRVKPKYKLILNSKKLQNRRSCIQESFLQSIHGLNNSIPKHIVSLDEKYLRRCLELIHNSASKAISCSISVSLSSSKMGFLSDSMNSTKIRDRSTCDLSRFVIECPRAPGTETVVINPAGQWIVGTITGSKSMSNILKSPLFRHCATLDGNVNFERRLIDAKESVCSDVISSPGGSTVSSSQTLQKKAAILGNQRYVTEMGHKRLVSMSSTNSSCSDQSSSSSSSFAQATVSQGMLQCTWKGGIPHFVFSIDDQREIYIANLWKVEPPDDKSLDYIYLFHSGTRGQKEHEAHSNESEIVGKMKVSSSFRLCPNDSKIMETEFVLFGAAENPVGEVPTSTHNLKKNKGFSKKITKAFRTSHLSRHRTTSKFDGTSTILENQSWDPCQDASKNLNRLSGANLINNDLPPNLELAAIIVRDHVHNNHQKAEVGGWGLKFLKKFGVKQTNPRLEASVSSGCCLQSTGDCSTNMDILVPAGIHGGPRTRNGGPSGLTERWRSGGCCDCGGWDLGCPLTILNTRSSKEVVIPQEDAQSECKSFDLFSRGSELTVPTLRMVNIHQGLYFIHFQSSLSALQSFSIAVAIIHSQSTTLRPKNIQESN